MTTEEWERREAARQARLDAALAKMGETIAAAISSLKITPAQASFVAQQHQPRRSDLIALIDERIVLALASLRDQSIQDYSDGLNGLPQSTDVPAGLVDGPGVRAGGFPASDLGDTVGRLTHDLAPSVGPEGSVGASPASGSASGAGDTPRGES